MHQVDLQAQIELIYDCRTIKHHDYNLKKSIPEQFHAIVEPRQTE